MSRAAHFLSSVAVVATIVTGSITAASALEVAHPGTPAEKVYSNGPKTPRILVLGDSISATKEQKDNDAFINAQGKNLGTEVRATAGFTILDHHPASGNDFRYAEANPDTTIAAVFVELGSNDMFDVNTEPERTAVWNEIEFAMRAMPKKCVVWMGLDTRGNAAYTPESAANFNQFIWSRSGEHAGGEFPNLHYGDYSHLIQTNSSVRAALDADPWGLKLHFGGDAAPAARTALAQFELATLDRFCI